MDWMAHGLRYVDDWIGFQMRASRRTAMTGCTGTIWHHGLMRPRCAGSLHTS